MPTTICSATSSRMNQNDIRSPQVFPALGTHMLQLVWQTRNIIFQMSVLQAVPDRVIRVRVERIDVDTHCAGKQDWVLDTKFITFDSRNVQSRSVTKYTSAE